MCLTVSSTETYRREADDWTASGRRSTTEFGPSPDRGEPVNHQIDAEWDDNGWRVVTVAGVPVTIAQTGRLDHVCAGAEARSLKLGES